MVSELEKTLAECRSYGAQADLVHADFIQWAQSTDKRFDVVIQNPPYFKLGAKSEVVTSLKKLGYTTPNIYAAFYGSWCTSFSSRWFSGINYP